MKDKRERRSFAQLTARLSGIPHLFSKAVVIWCIGCMTAFSAYGLRILSRTGHDPAGLLGVILLPFGGELLILCVRTILNGKGGS